MWWRVIQNPFEKLNNRKNSVKLWSFAFLIDNSPVGEIFFWEYRSGRAIYRITVCWSFFNLKDSSKHIQYIWIHKAHIAHPETPSRAPTSFPVWSRYVTSIFWQYSTSCTRSYVWDLSTSGRFFMEILTKKWHFFRL